ncbi:hypothetical protein F5X68DRAFT_249465 [Plectosphaerella plurivora]|uniref:Uncharacterized protein n=1 Tax=Plectosphaerella plurivora TaxID=936078 RepID=A0A9P9A5S6_9PEZI|nr:hypothetical protein F5X68DRAFT_249465 [Plectosphaerella plurivora]
MVTYAPTEPQLQIDWVFRSLAHAQVAGSPGVIDDPQYLKTNAYRGDVNLTVNVEKIHHSMPVVVAEILSTGPRFESDTAGPPSLFVHRALFYPCAQTYLNLSATPEAMPMPGAKILTEPMGFIEDDRLFTDLYRVPSTGEIMIFYNFSHLLILEFLFSFFSSLSANVVFVSDMRDEEYMLTVAHFTVEKTLGPWVRHQGVGRAIKNIVTTLGSLIRNDELGDNMAAQMLEGVAWEMEVYFNVRWAWITVIVVETPCITILLAISIALTWRDSLVRDSSFALLLHGLEGWDTVRLSGPETTSSLDKMAKGMPAKLEAGQDGILRFQKQDQEGDGESTK